MNRIQFWVLTYSIILIAPLFLTDIYLSNVVRENGRKAVLLQRIAQEGTVYASRWQQLATRVYQGSQQDPALRDVLLHQHVNITPKASANAAAAPSADSSLAPSPKATAPNRTQ